MTEKEKTAFGALLSNHLVSNGITQLDLSRSIGTSQSYVSQFMNGIRQPDPQWVTVIADSLNLPLQARQQLYYAAAKAQWPDLPELDLTKK